MPDLDYGFAFLLNSAAVRDKVAPPDPRAPFARAYVTAEVRSFIYQTRSTFPYSDYPGVCADNVTKRAIAAYFEAGDWIRASIHEDLAQEERREWRMNAAVLALYADQMIEEAKQWEYRWQRYNDDSWIY